MSKSTKYVLSRMIVGFAALPLAYGQGLTGQIAGTIVDPGGANVASARIVLSNIETTQIRETVSDPTGAFLFTDLLPGRYGIAVEAPGFKRYEQPQISLSATERVTLREITLEMGQVTEQVVVTGTPARIETQSSERSGLINNQQLQNISLKGRDYLGMMKLLPGVTDSANRESPGFTITGSGNGGLVGLNIDGNKEHTINMTLDGISDLETGSDTGPWISPSLEAIGEMKVLLTNYQAEYGRTSGGTINVVIKNGTKDFHGSGYYFARNEAFNANNFFNNRQGVQRDRYRYNDLGYSVGGPVLIPRLLKRRDKLFFFWSEEYIPKNVPLSQIRLTMPTGLERQGDFSQTVDTNGKLIVIKDPSAGGAAFPRNVIPRTRIDPAGQALLNVFDMPNTVDPNHTFNYVASPTVDDPWREELLRVDYNISSKDMFYMHLALSSEDHNTAMDTALGAKIWPQFPTNYHIGGRGAAATYIHTFSPTLVNEFTFGINRGTQLIAPLTQEALARNSRTGLGAALPQFYPEINPLNLLPNATFAGVSNAPQLSIENRFPYHGNGNVWNWTDNLTKVMGSHNIKAGFYIENASRNGPRPSNATGAYSFDRDVNNPYDSNYAFSNAILGSVDSYSESDNRPFSQSHYQNFEWFIQDSWRATKRITIDAGLRFYKIIPSYLFQETASAFAPDLYDAANAPILIQPYRATPTSARMGINPVTGQTVAPVLIGTFAPGTGNPANGMRVTHEQVLGAPGIQVTPRIGLAWDVFGDGKTAFRAGFGTFVDRIPDTNITQFVQFPPVTNTLSTYYTTIPQLLGAPQVQSPATVSGIESPYVPQAVYNWSAGIQRDIGFGTVLDVAYVGNVGRHLEQVLDLNALPYGTNFLATSADRTNPGKPLPANLLRPYRGYGSINYYSDSSSSNYHSMQTQVKRRFSSTFTFGVTWTWSKAMNYGDTDTSAINPFINPRVRNYGKAGFDHTHNLAIHYVYSLPQPFRSWDTPFSRLALGGWQLSGVTTFISGVPLGFTYSFVQSTDITGATGTGVDSRVILTGNPIIPAGDRTPSHAFDTSVVRPPLASNFGIGNAPRDAIRGPGINNWDISLFKNFPLGKNEGRRLEFRFETYNTFNHTQFSQVDAAARFDAAGNQVNTDFGWYTSAAAPRIMQLGVKVHF